MLLPFQAIPSPLTISPFSRQASTLLQPRPIEWAQPGADPIGRLEEELIQLGDASGQVGEALQVGEQQEARRLLGRGGASGAAAVPGLAHNCGCVGRFVWCVLSYHLIT